MIEGTHMADRATALSVLMPKAEEPASDYIVLEPEKNDGPDVIEEEDGSLTYTLGEDGEPEPSADDSDEFYANLAEALPQIVTDRIVQDLLRLIDEDKKAREPRDKQYEDGIKRTGLSKDAPGGAEFEGASKVAHPMLTQACIDFEARVIKEMWPPNGPVVRPKILGEASHDKTQKADRKTAYMNYQLTTIIQEGRSVMESTLSQVPLGGAQYVKLWQDPHRRRPCMQFIPIDKTILPANAASWASSHRRTFADNVTNVEFTMRINAGLYRRAANLSPPSSLPDTTKAQAASQKVEGLEVTTSGMNQDAEREIYETMSYLEVTEDMVDYLNDIEEAGELYPYLITIDVQNRTMLAMYRDWEPEDEAREPIDHLFEFPCIPWRGAQAIGIAHVIGGLTASATGALRALLDSAFIANLQGGIFLKGSGKSGGDLKPKPGEWTEMDAGLEAQDIRQRFLPYSTKEPSAVLFQLLGFLVDAGTGAVRTSMDQEAIDTNANTPVGTQLSRVEEGLAVFSAIHGRIHAAFDRLLAGLHRLNRMYLPEAVNLTIDGKEVFIKRSDFEGPPDVQPVSEPTIVSNQQRMAQILAVEQSAVALAALPQYANLFDMRAIQKRKFKIWNISDPEELLPEPPKPVELNAINENLAMALAKPVTVFPEQDHLAHLQAHLDFGQSPALGANPIIATKFLPTFLQHCSEHMLYFYVQQIHGVVSQAAGVDAAELFSKDPDIKQDLDKVLAMASSRVVTLTDQTFSKAIGVIQKSMETLKSLMPPAPVDPGTAAVQAAAAETKRRTTDDARKAAIESAKMGLTDKQAAAKNVVAMHKIETDAQKAERATQAKLAESVMDNQTARDIEAARLAAGDGGHGGGHMTDGDSISE